MGTNLFKSAASSQKCFHNGDPKEGRVRFVFRVPLVLGKASSCNCHCNCNCKYDKLYSTVGGKPLLGCFTRTFTVSAISNARDHRSSSFNCFLKAGGVLVARIVAGRLFQVRGPATSKARSPILVLVLGTKTSAEFDDRSRDLLQSFDSGLILSAKMVRCCSDIYTPGWKFACQNF